MLGRLHEPLNLRTLPSPVLVIGAAFSGKSDFAVQALNQQMRAAVIGTADTSEAELKELVEYRQKRRPEFWKTYESIDDLPKLFAQLAADNPQVLLDSINQWVARVFVYAGAKHGVSEVERIIESEADQICELLKAPQTARIVLVTSEVAAGLSPPTPTARAFRQVSSRINCRIAAACQSVVLVTAGIPLVIKGEPLELA